MHGCEIIGIDSKITKQTVNRNFHFLVMMNKKVLVWDEVLPFLRTTPGLFLIDLYNFFDDVIQC